jgi:hypothetical protein
MKLNESQLKQIIKEELQKVLRENVENLQQFYKEMDKFIGMAPPYKETKSIIDGYLKAKQSKFGGGTYKKSSGGKLEGFLDLLDKVIEMGGDAKKFITTFLWNVNSTQAQQNREWGSHPYDYADPSYYSYAGVREVVVKELQKALKEAARPLPSEMGAMNRAASAATAAKEKPSFEVQLFPSQYYVQYFEKDNTVRIGFVSSHVGYNATENRVKLAAFQQFVQNPQKVPAGMSGLAKIIIDNKQKLEKFLQDVDRKFVNSAEKQFFSSQATPQPYVREGSSKR